MQPHLPPSSKSAAPAGGWECDCNRLRSAVVKPRVIADRAELLRLLQGQAVVAVDGRMAVGKTTLATSLTGALRGTLIQTDAFIESQWGRETRSLFYPELLDLEALEVRIRNAMKRGPVVVDGICIRDTMVRIGRTPDVHVLVSVMDPASAKFRLGIDDAMETRSGPTGVHDAALLDDSILEEELMDVLLEDWGTLDLINERSLVAYFKRMRPHRTANVVFLRA